MQGRTTFDCPPAVHIHRADQFWWWAGTDRQRGTHEELYAAGDATSISTPTARLRKLICFWRRAKGAAVPAESVSTKMAAGRQFCRRLRLIRGEVR
jgi:hypothetical protein